MMGKAKMERKKKEGTGNIRRQVREKEQLQTELKTWQKKFSLEVEFG